jgi:hypothetical protein
VADGFPGADTFGTHSASIGHTHLLTKFERYYHF